MQSEESDSSSSSTVDIPDNIKSPQIFAKWRQHTYCHIASLMRHKPYAQRIRKRRKPVLIKSQANRQRYLQYNHPMPVPSESNNTTSKLGSSEKSNSQNTSFKQREITTIYEEVYQCSKAYHNRISKPRGFQEKVASLKVIVSRLQKMCLEKPEVLQNTIPDETIKRFKAIHIK
ncbi:hypothetical protein HNY73_008252 [Argiope bruennichi]|uniref:Uncharacterized protein n=1 Tax=Argiope bruennichi TaxID=94029 RepID=A0A8T0F8L2_ARGBR|nr:hypothetical protein HNY73_008252 [Argiope bruennichi]